METIVTHRQCQWQIFFKREKNTIATDKIYNMHLTENHRAEYFESAVAQEDSFLNLMK